MVQFLFISFTFVSPCCFGCGVGRASRVVGDVDRHDKKALSYLDSKHCVLVPVLLVLNSHAITTYAQLTFFAD